VGGIALLGAATLTLGLCARVTERSWIAPSVLFLVLWGCYLGVSSLFIVDPQVVLGGVLWIALSCALVYAGTLVGARAVHPRLAPVPPAGSSAAGGPLFPGLRSIVVACAVVGVIEIGFLFARQGYSWRSVVSFAVIAELTATLRSDYGYGALQQGTLERVGFLILYSGPLFGGLLFRTARNGLDRALGVSTLVVTIVALGLYGSRMGVLFGGSFWVAAYLAASVLQLARGVRNDAGVLLRAGVVTALLLLGVSLGAQAVRYTARTEHLDWFRMFADPFGFLAAFGIWFDQHGVRFTDLYFGARSLRRLVEPLGISQPLAPAIEVGFVSSNIYTVFRDLIEDFGSVGALLLLFAYGWVGSVANAHVAAGRLGWVPVLTFVFVLGLTSFAISIFLYTVTAGAVGLFLLYFVLCRVRWTGPTGVPAEAAG
jgi:oligosaccharide repeat unit polymerase